MLVISGSDSGSAVVNNRSIRIEKIVMSQIVAETRIVAATRHSVGVERHTQALVLRIGTVRHR